MAGKTLKGAVKSKTIWASVIVGAIGAAISNFDLLRPVLSEEVYGMTLMGLSVLFAVLRVVTTTPLDEK